MTKSLNTSSVVSCSKDRKCKKPCKSSSSSSCCSEQCIDCCSSQYQRLSKLANIVAASQLAGSWNVAVNLNDGGVVPDIDPRLNRSGTVIPPPNTDSGSVNGAYYNVYAGCSASGDLNVPTSLVGASGTLNAVGSDDMLVAAASYYFVNEHSYGPYEPGCHNDQVYGWYVNLESGELQLFTQVDGVPTNATRACLSANLSAALTSGQKKQLKVLNKLYKLSKSAVKEVNGIPSQEGNIVEVCDCKGEKWLVYVNTASSQNGSPLGSSNLEFALVATKLC